MRYFFGTLSSVRSPKWSATVVPLSSDDLNSSSEDKNIDGISAMHLLHNVADSILLQKDIDEMMSDSSSSLCDEMLIEEILEDGVEILDACNFLLEKIGFVRKYVESIQMAVHLIKPGMAPVAVKRVKELLDKRRYSQGDVDQCRSRLKRLVSKLKRRRWVKFDILTSSMADALDTCQRLDSALSFKRGRRSCAGGCMEQMVELRDAMAWAKRLRDLTVEKGGEVDTWCVETVENKCERLVGGVGLLEGRVKELYSRVACVRMTVLGILSQSHHHL